MSGVSQVIDGRELSRQKEEGAVAQDGGCLAHLKDSKAVGQVRGELWERR